jgi:amino acid permease
MSDLRFALITSVILVLSYATALSVHSLDRVLAYVGSTGSTSISFILPGLFYYKISDPDGPHHQRLTKEDDDADLASEDEDDDEATAIGSRLMDSVGSLQSGISVLSGAGNRILTRLRKKWRWDLEHLDPVWLRKLSLALAIYGICVMVICLVMNTFKTVSH